MRLLLLKIAFLFSFTIPIVESRELEPRYSRKTPFRQQTDIPEPVFGIGHGLRRFNGDKSSREEQPLSPFFGERREPGRRNSGREDGRDYEENGDEENRFGRRRPFGFGRHGSPDDEEEESRDGSFPRENHDFKRPNLPDPTDIKERFDKERKRGGQERGNDGEEENHQAPGRGRGRSEDEEENGHKGEEEEEEHRPRRPQYRNRNGEEDEDQRRNHRPRHEDPDRERQHHWGEDEDQETENIAETPSKVVGLNMQMVAGVYPKEKKGPVVEDVDKRGGRFVDKPDEREQNKFFRGSEPDDKPEESDKDTSRRQEQKHEEPRDRRPTAGDSGKSEKRSRGENSGSGDERPRKERRREESEEKPNREQRGPQGPPQQQAPPPPKPEIPPFPAFPKFPSFGGFQPFQPDFPTRSFGGNGGFASGPWNEPGRSPGRQTALGEDAGSSEDRSRQDGRRIHEQNPSSAPSDNSSSHDDSAERRHSTGDNSKENERGRKGEFEKREGNEDKKDGREHLDSREEQKEDVPQEVNHQDPPPTSSPRKEFPTPGRFVTNIRAKKSGEILDATTAPPTTSTTSLPTAITFPVISTTTTTLPPPTGIMLPTETIATKLRSIVNQRIKVV
ncbi:hypothetical protein CAEBREN_26294 [Caenorhabditis brenneri]|uniref:Uncharacterized protein n=1 Tax=Caenorhabditis brenneri TaxID=135651 RepID=G0PKY0_CAEBE|nr:hypothetical protein CAEBREN_26294 [Caenorhabditis brenneri]